MKTNPNEFADYKVFDFGDGTKEETGLTKREHFAALALQGLLSNSGIHAMAVKKELGKDLLVSLHANMAVEHADALIEALNTPVKP